MENSIWAEICARQFLHRSQVVFLAYISIIVSPIEAVAVSKVFDNNSIECIPVVNTLNQSLYS